MTPPVLTSHCLRHAGRPAVVRCPGCGQFYCRECVVEHERRWVCAECLRRHSTAVSQTATRVPWAALLQWVVAAVVLWSIFLGLAAVLRSVPAGMREEMIWKPQGQD